MYTTSEVLSLIGVEEKADTHTYTHTHTHTQIHTTGEVLSLLGVEENADITIDRLLACSPPGDYVMRHMIM